MGHQVIIFDFSLIRGLWETRVKKSKERQKKEEERLEKSSLEKHHCTETSCGRPPLTDSHYQCSYTDNPEMGWEEIREWNFILECRKRGIPQAKYLRNGFVDTNEKILDTYGKTPQIQKRRALSDEADKERNKFIFRLSGEQWMEFPDSLKEQTYLKEWHVCNTLIQTIPAYIASFQDLTVLELSKNQINHLPVEIGCLKNLKVLNVSFNNLKSVPPELGDCENLEKLDLSGNMEITELPFELRSLGAQRSTGLAVKN
ncbi:PREDICTED: leucine-rich repeat-containing protein 2-like [Buceros rhinoceros silvestris]|uniref:leucine-rich repeat-containing protein 2-like n=1 Tax=Buceros rhinoceros silvestris TaxID=175836 RepID=UPI00052958B6|nr:PREDICTED: leucine-rich repeat-containing protein 2-like [Buceros rhinoceros silvestris]